MNVAGVNKSMYFGFGRWGKMVKIQRLCTLGVLWLGGVGVGCTGGPLSVDDMEADERYEDVVPGEVSMRRLTQAQFRNTIRDLYGDEVVVPEISEPDVVLGGLPSVGASEATYSSRGVESWEAAAFSIAEQVFADEARRSRWVTCTPQQTVDTECAATTLREMGRYAWHAPAFRGRSHTIGGCLCDRSDHMDDFYAGLEFGLGALLQSPYFMYRVEMGIPDPNGGLGRQFTAYEMAYA